MLRQERMRLELIAVFNNDFNWERALEFTCEFQAEPILGRMVEAARRYDAHGLEEAFHLLRRNMNFVTPERQQESWDWIENHAVIKG